MCIAHAPCGASHSLIASLTRQLRAQQTASWTVDLCGNLPEERQSRARRRRDEGRSTARAPPGGPNLPPLFAAGALADAVVSSQGCRRLLPGRQASSAVASGSASGVVQRATGHGDATSDRPSSEPALPGAKAGRAPWC